MTIHETRRLKLIPFTLELKRAVLADKKQLSELLGNVRAPDTWPGPDIAEALPFFISQLEKQPSAPVWDGIIVHKEDQVIIGDMGFMGPPDATGRVEIGYSIIPEYRNQGYATEMACHLIAWGLNQSGVTSVVASCSDNNLSSIKVLEKAGMRRLSPDGNLLKWEIQSS
ncbi:MAG: GNAT family N-acetyltransferase [Ktedonobacteraceae bacterium]